MCYFQLILVDNSKFMQGEKDEVIKVVAALAYLLKELDPDGIEVVCTSEPGNKKKFKTSKEVRNFVTNAFQQGREDQCAIETALGVVLREARLRLANGTSRGTILSIDRLRKGPFGQRSRASASEALSILVFTNGVWDYSEGGLAGADQPIQGLINHMKLNNINRTEICINFVRFGADPRGIERLRFLDDELEGRQGNEG